MLRPYEIAFGHCRLTSLWYPIGVRWRLASMIALLALTGAVGCRREAIDEDPERLVKEFIERVKSVYGDPKMARGAFDFCGQARKRI